MEDGRLVVLDLLDKDITNDSIRNLVKGGKRVRPTLVGQLTSWNNPDFALAVEYLHKSKEARDGTLVFLALSHISAGYRRLLVHYDPSSHLRLREILDEETSNLLGPEGFCKYRLSGDLHLEDRPARQRREVVLDQIKSSIGSLFSLCFLLSWLSNGGHTEYIHNIKDIGYDFGLCYSICYCNDNLRKYISRNELIDLFVQTNRRMMEGCKLFRLDQQVRKINMYLMDVFTRMIRS